MLKQFRTYYCLLLSILFLVGCVDDVEIPTPSEGDVLFSASATLDGQVLSLSAGKEEHFMFTEVATDSNDVYLFKGTLGEIGCQYCAGALTFEFVQEQDNLQFPLSSIAAAPIQFRNSTVSINTIGYNVDFEMELQGVAPFTMVWDFGDNVNVTTTNTAIQHEYQNDGIYNVCVHVTDATGCESEICRTISTDNAMNCGINFTVHNFPNFQNTFYLNALSSGYPPFDYDWNIAIDSINFMNFTQTSPSVTMNQIGIMPVNVFMTDARNCNASVTQTVDFINPDAICLQQYDYNATALTEFGLPQSYFSTLTIRYTDDNGVVFASDLGEQAPYTTLSILDVEEFEVDNNGNPTKKITLEFACRLYDEDGNFKNLENGLATIAVAYLP
jgi:hypothetical protein